MQIRHTSRVVDLGRPARNVVSHFISCLFILVRLQIVDSDQVVLTSSTDHTVRLWSALGGFIGGCHLASVTPVCLDIINVHANGINLEHDSMVKEEMLFM